MLSETQSSQGDVQANVGGEFERRSDKRLSEGKEILFAG